MEGASLNASSNLKSPSLCDECGSIPWKYRCPGCSIRSCSLPCVNSHKKRTSCTGKRSRAEVVPLSLFDEEILLSDYNLLEETKKAAESARRKNGGLFYHSCFKLPTKLWMLRNAANRRRIQLLLCPDGLSKRKNNKSRYDKRKNSISWTIEIRFHGTDVAILRHGVDEYGSLLSIFEKHLAPDPWKHKLRPFCDVQLDDLKLFLRKNPKDLKSPYRKLDMKAPIGSQLEDSLILDYPVIFVFLPSHDCDFEVETSRTPPPPVCDDMPTPSVTLYKEEVEGDEASDTRITDLTESRYEDIDIPASTCRTNEIPKPANAVHCTDIQIAEKSNGGFRYQLCGKNRGAPTPNSFDSVDAGFYFDQEVRDAYADLVGEMNPDDFLCLDGVDDDDHADSEEAGWYEMVESQRFGTVKLMDGELDQLTGYDLGENKGDEYFNENLINELEKTEGNVLPEEKRESFFFSDENPFGEMELEEGEIPFFLC